MSGTATRGQRAKSIPEKRPTGAHGAAPAPRASLRPLLAAATVFVAAGAVLMLEILAVRLLAPYVGLTLETTTSIIGAVLAGIALGAAVGGWLADRRDPRAVLVAALIGGGLLALLTVPIVRALGPSARGHGNLAALGVTLASLVPSAAVLSAVSPTVARLQLRDLEASGTIVGRLSAFATAGALVGTFGTGFVIVPAMPVSTAVFGIGVVLVLGGLALGTHLRVLGRRAGAAAAVAGAVFALISLSQTSPCDVETSYHCAVVETAQGATGRELILDGSHNSHVDLANPKDLFYPYIRWIAHAIDTTAPSATAPRDAVFVGGGGGTLPRWLQATRPRSRSEVLEVDGRLVRLDERRMGLRPGPNLHVRVGDARTTMLQRPTHSADVVVGDAFSGLTVPWHLLTREWIDEVKRVLRPGGLYALNIIDFEKEDLLKAELATLQKRFRDVQAVTVPNEDGLPGGGNTVVLASDTQRAFDFDPQKWGAYVYNNDEVAAFAKGGTLLRDDFAPVDQLMTTPPGVY
jgi:spermidine synthase